MDEGTYIASLRSIYRVARGRGRSPRATRSALPSAPQRAAAGGRGAQRHVDVGRDETARSGQVDVLLPVRAPGPVQPLHRGLDGACADTAPIATWLISETLDKQGIDRGTLTIHSDRGASQTAKPVAHLLADLGVTKSLSRPRVSNDNPYSESQFKTLKYRPSFPNRFESKAHATVFCREFFGWYNDKHRHSGISFHTPASVYFGHAPAIHAARSEVLAAAYARHPERFVRKHPEPPALPGATWINRPLETEEVTQ